MRDFTYENEILGLPMSKQSKTIPVFYVVDRDGGNAELSKFKFKTSYSEPPVNSYMFGTVLSFLEMIRSIRKDRVTDYCELAALRVKNLDYVDIACDYQNIIELGNFDSVDVSFLDEIGFKHGAHSELYSSIKGLLMRSQIINQTIIPAKLSCCSNEF